MNAKAIDLIHKILSLPISDRFFVIEETMKSIREEATESMEAAAIALLDDYNNDKELTAFTALDLERFYEAG